MSLSFLMRDKLKEALKASRQPGGDSLEVSVLRMLLAALHNKEIEKMDELSVDEETEILLREVKRRCEAVDVYRSAGREDLAKQEEEEIKIIEVYLPERMSGEDLKDLVRKAVSEVGASGPSDLGRVMGRVMPRVKGRAKGGEVRELVTELLTQS